jgi:hypothetical protein
LKTFTNLTTYVWMGERTKLKMFKKLKTFTRLPASLVFLNIFNLKDIECLDGKWIQHLTSLRTLVINNALKLKSLPEEGKFPSSLQELRMTAAHCWKQVYGRSKGKSGIRFLIFPSYISTMKTSHSHEYHVPVSHRNFIDVISCHIIEAPAPTRCNFKILEKSDFPLNCLFHQCFIRFILL